MIRKAYIIGIMSLGLFAATGARAGMMLNRVVSSAQSFEYYFKDLRTARSSLSPVERFVFSLVLANNPAAASSSSSCSPADRT